MNEAEDVRVEVREGHITVRLRGTSMKAVYKNGESPWLMLVGFIEDKGVPIKLARFWALAWTAANDKGRGFGLDRLKLPDLLRSGE
jgi:hypothetical protein